MSTALPFLTDDEIRTIAHPLTQPAAIVRWFKNNGFTALKVRPNGMPLIARAYFDQVTAGLVKAEERSDMEPPQPNVAAYLARISPEAKAARKSERDAARTAQKLTRSKS